MAERRPTQRFNFELLNEDLLPGEDIAVDEEPTIAENTYYEPIEEPPTKKSVAFDNMVEEMQIEKIEDEEEEETEDESSDIENSEEEKVVESSDKENLIEENQTVADKTDAVPDKLLVEERIPKKSMGFDDVVSELKIVDEQAFANISQKGRNSNESDS